MPDDLLCDVCGVQPNGFSGDKYVCSNACMMLKAMQKAHAEELRARFQFANKRTEIVDHMLAHLPTNRRAAYL